MSRERNVLLATVIAFALLCQAGCGGGSLKETNETPPTPVVAGTIRVLFIGNSLTAANDLPAMVVELARQSGAITVEVDSVLRGGFSLEDHWREGSALKRIQAQHWDFVVLQQGPSSLPESRVELVRWTQQFAAEIRKSGAVPALYMVWPSLDRIDFMMDVSDSYRAAAKAVNGFLLPAGDAWRFAMQGTTQVALYGPDGFHPTVEGSLLAAMTVYSGLCQCKLNSLPAELPLSDGSRVPIPADQAAALLAATAQAMDGAR